jgi:RNA polymerase sigma-70 factor (ECF subfamily)
MESRFPTNADLGDLRRLLVSSALPLTRNRADAEDLVQVAFTRALERSTALASDADWGLWLRTVVRRLGIDLIRRHRRWRFAQLEPASLEAPSLESSPQWASLTATEVRAALEHCDPLYGRVFELHYFENVSYADIARRLDIPAGTVATRLHRARARLRAVLEARSERIADGSSATEELSWSR